MGPTVPNGHDTDGHGGTVKARWHGTCSKCGTIWEPGDDIKPWYRRVGMTQDGKPNWVRVPKKYVHAPKCPKVTPNRPGQHPPPGVDPLTGEITVAHSPQPHQETLL